MFNVELISITSFGQSSVESHYILHTMEWQCIYKQAFRSYCRPEKSLVAREEKRVPVRNNSDNYTEEFV